MKVAVFAPMATSLFSRLMTFALHREPGIEVGLVLVRSPWSLRRLRAEFRRDGPHLIRKVARNMVLGDARFGQDDRHTQMELAREWGLPAGSLHGLTKALSIPLVGCDEFTDAHAVKALAGAAPDVVVFTGGGMLRQSVLSIPKLGILNCHLGILPEYRGMDVVEWPALQGGLTEPGIGFTAQFMNAGLDTGPILSTRRMPLEPDDDFTAIRRRMAHDTVISLLQTVRELRDGTVEAQPQAVGDGHQYYVMHPTLLDIATRRLRAHLRGKDGL